MTDTTFYQPGMQTLPARVTERAPGPAAGSIATILARLEEAVDDETAGLRADPRYDLRTSNARKSRHLYELNRAMKGMGPTDLGGQHREALQRLRNRLDENEMVLKAHLGAVGEVAALLQDVIERHEADGTYTSTAARQAARA